MKKTIALLLAVTMMLMCAFSMAEETVVDTTASASVADYYGDFALTGEDLMNAINSYSGFYALSTVNEDGTPNVAFFVYGCVEHEGSYYLQLGLAPNQSSINLERTGKAMAMYAAAPSGDYPYAVCGARMELSLVTDAELIAALNTNPDYAPYFCEIVELKPLG